MLLPSAKRNRTDQGFDGLSSGTISARSSSASASTSAAASAAASSEPSLPSEMEDGRDNSDGDALVEQWSRAQNDLGCTVCRQLLCRPITLPCGCSCCQVQIGVKLFDSVAQTMTCIYHISQCIPSIFPRKIENHAKFSRPLECLYCFPRLSLSHTRFVFSRSTACMPRRPCLRAAAPR
jgi:hypothetical protein